jgi:hypothetical protein
VRRRDFGVNLVGGDLQQRVLGVDLIAGSDQPSADGGFGDTFAQRWQDDGYLIAIHRDSFHFAASSAVRTMLSVSML